MNQKLIAATLIGIIGFFALAQTPTKTPSTPAISPTQTAAVLQLKNSDVVTTQNTGNTSNTNSKSSTVRSNNRNIATNNVTTELRKTLIGTTVTTKDGEQVLVYAYKPAAVPNDPNSGQWWEPTIGVNQFWDLEAPKKQTVLAVIDTGFALNHQEFNGRIFENQGEVGVTSFENISSRNCTDRSLSLNASCNLVDDDVDGVVDNEVGATPYENPSRLNCTDRSLPINKNCNNRDDDGNGYIDDVSGWDFVNFDNKPLAGELNPSGTGTQHGSMVMGIAGANANNNVGIAGIDWYTKLLPIQAIDDDSYGNTLTVAAAIRYAADMGADVINLSLGTGSYDSYLLAAVEYAVDKNVVVVAAAGNTDCNCMIYPAAFEAVLSVGALNQQGTRASFSSYGANLDIMAPGVNITSSIYSSSNQTSAYATGSGTSYASPMISGLVSRLKGELPNSTVAQLIALVTEQTNEVKAGQANKSATNGFGTSAFNQSAVRSTTPIGSNGIYALGYVSDGGIFSGVRKNTLAYICEPGRTGTTPLYKASKSGLVLYSINDVDKRKASLNGYSVSQLLRTCILQSHDPVEKIRLLNTPLEFENLNFKSLGL